MTEIEPLKPVLEEMAIRRPESDAEGRRAYQSVKRDAERFVITHPGLSATVLEFQFTNLASEGIRLEAVGLLYHLGSLPDHRGRALQVLGLAEQNDSVAVARAAVRASNAVTRRGAGDHSRRKT